MNEIINKFLLALMPECIEDSPDLLIVLVDYLLKAKKIVKKQLLKGYDNSFNSSIEKKKILLYKNELFSTL